jgi:hypothetical protein
MPNRQQRRHPHHHSRSAWIEWADIEFMHLDPGEDCPMCGPSPIHDHPSVKNGAAPAAGEGCSQDLPVVSSPGRFEPTTAIED